MTRQQATANASDAIALARVNAQYVLFKLPKNRPPPKISERTLFLEPCHTLTPYASFPE